ncbi:MAG TPA: BPSS1780 family membrane protein [Usitatibacter sp.]|nr:BPSS1780 family membrane protein [Usitatibacter sp.]
MPETSGLQLVLPGRYVGFGASLGWIGRSWKLFAQAPLMWILAVLIFFVGSLVVQVIPILGFIASTLLSPVYVAGFAVGCRSLETGGEFELDQLLAGFKEHTVDLVVVGLVMLLGEILAFLIFLMIVGFAIFEAIYAAFISGDAQAVEAILVAMGLKIVLGVLVMLLFLIPLLAAYWFAPFLVVMHGMKPIEAMKASLTACIRNFFPMAFYGLGMIVVGVVACIPAIVPILGWLVTAAAFFVLMVMGFIAIYTGYRDMFTEDPRITPTVTV